MSQIRVLKALPSEISPIASQAMAWGGYVDWVQEGTPDDIPGDAIYALHRDDNGRLRVVISAPASLEIIHDFAGWGEVDIPYPTAY